MRFWDTSALVPLVFPERETARVERWLREDPGVVVWALTRVELLSALARRRREDPKAAPRLQAARREVIAAWERWSEVTEIDVVRRHAERLVESHPLRAADALQVGAALVVAADRPESLRFVTLDRTQAVAAEREGFRVLGPE
ncbi:MAG: type II toxin-antitoxin system VapC family toxin [Candidatus Rokuibacteriota bacterium]